jgi:hypothetical protein
MRRTEQQARSNPTGCRRISRPRIVEIRRLTRAKLWNRVERTDRTTATRRRRIHPGEVERANSLLLESGSTVTDEVSERFANERAHVARGWQWTARRTERHRHLCRGWPSRLGIVVARTGDHRFEAEIARLPRTLFDRGTQHRSH